MTHYVPEVPFRGEFVIRCGKTGSGSQHAWRDLLEYVAVENLAKLKQRVGWAVRRKRGPRLDRDDAVQKVVERLIQLFSNGKFDMSKSSSVWGFVDAVARHVVSDMQRTLVRQEIRQARYVELKPAFAESPLDQLEKRELMEKTRQAYFGLPKEKQDKLLVLYPFLEPERTTAPIRGRPKAAHSDQAMASLRAALETR